MAFLIISFASAIFCSGDSVVPGADVDDGPNGVDEPDGDVDWPDGDVDGPDGDVIGPDGDGDEPDGVVDASHSSWMLAGASEEDLKQYSFPAVSPCLRRT